MSQQLRNEVKRLKPDILSRDKDKCYVCGFDCKPVLNVHHIVPVSKGGTNDSSNMVSLCPNCHAIAHRWLPLYHQLGEGMFAFGPDDLSTDERELWYWLLKLSIEQSDRFLAIARMQALQALEVGAQDEHVA